MTFTESVHKHEAFNDILQLMNSDKKFRNEELFDAVYQLAFKQGEMSEGILEANRNSK